MANPLFNMFGTNMSPIPGRFGNFMNLVNQFNQFKQTFKGDPKQQVQNMLNSGQMTQNQFNQLQTIATQFQKMLNNQ